MSTLHARVRLLCSRVYSACTEGASALHCQYSKRLADQRALAAYLGSVGSQEHHGDPFAVGLLCCILSIHHSISDPFLLSNRVQDSICSPITGEEQHQSSALLQVRYSTQTHDIWW